MNKILVVNASARKERSLSRLLTSLFLDKWKEQNNDTTVVYRDVGMGNIPHLNEEWVVSAFKPANLRTEKDIDALKISTELIQELKDADIIVLGAPMYNWSIPSSLKAYIDQVLRVNETVLINPENHKNPYVGLLKDKKAYLLMVRGNSGYEQGEYFEHMNFQSNYLKTVLGIMGIDDVHEVILNGSTHGEDAVKIAMQTVDQRMDQLANTY